MSVFNQGWYVAYTRQQHEKRVSERLGIMGLNNFLPTVKLIRNWGGKKRSVFLPLFPSYLFVQLLDLNGYFESLSADGLLNYVKFGKEIPRVSESVIDSIRIAVNNGKNLEVSSDNFIPGQKILIHKGPLTGLQGEICEFAGRHRVLVRVSLLRRTLLVNLEPSDVLAPAV